MARPVTSSSDAVVRKQVELLRNASLARRIALTRSLSATVISLARRAIRQRRPEMTERETLYEFLAIHYGEVLAGRVREFVDRREA